MKQRVLLSGLTTFRIGGPCEMYMPETIERAVEILRMSCPVLGGGSNVLAADAGLRVPLLHTGKLNAVVFNGRKLRAGCGAPLPELARLAARKKLSGLEWASGIPGLLGGAVVMNAGAYGGEMSRIVTSARVHTAEGEIITVTDFAYSYRHSVFSDHPDWTVLEADLLLTPGKPEEIAARMAETRQKRQDKQPLNMPSAGSFFKRPSIPGVYTAALIERCGLKGARVGGAQVSDKHAGFIVNVGDATCDDVLRLASRVRDTVFRESGVALEPEVKLLGDVKW